MPEFAPRYDYEQDWALETGQSNDSDVALQRRIESSELWLTIKRAWTEHREVVLQTKIEKIEDIWHREGAIQMLTYLLHHTPVLVVLQARRDEHE